MCDFHVVMRSPNGCVAFSSVAIYQVFGTVLITCGIVLTFIGGRVQMKLFIMVVRLLVGLLILSTLVEVGFLQITLTPWAVVMFLLSLVIAFGVSKLVALLLEY
jgi:hypothetical protein